MVDPLDYGMAVRMAGEKAVWWVVGWVVPWGMKRVVGWVGQSVGVMAGPLVETWVDARAGQLV